MLVGGHNGRPGFSPRRLSGDPLGTANISRVKSKQAGVACGIVLIAIVGVASPGLAAKKDKGPPNGCKLIGVMKDRRCIGTDVEAWYNTEASALPTPLPTSLSGLPPVNPYADQTLHTGVKDGQEDSRTYITFDTATLGLTAIPTGGTLVIPVDPEDSTAVKGADLQACLVEEPPSKSVRGSLDTPPKVDCSVQADPRFHPKPRAYLTFDLSPFASSIAAGAGIALVPTQQAASDQQTWHLEAYAKKSTAKRAMTIGAMVKVQKISEPSLGSIIGSGPPLSSGGSFAGSGASAPISGGSSGGSSGGFSLGGSTGGSAGGGTGSNIAASADTSGTQPSPAPVALAPVAAVRYPGVWFVPLALVIGASFFGFALTKEVILRRS